MYQPKDQRQEVVDPDRPGRELFLKEITDSGNYDSTGYQEFHPLTVKTDQIEHTQCERERMTNGKGGNQNEHLFPIVNKVDRCQCCNE